MPVNKTKLFFKVFSAFFILTAPLTAGEYRVASLMPAGDAAYGFGILQYRDYFSNLPVENSGLYVDFDTEALYLQQLFFSDKFFYGLDLKGHAYDWQNLAHNVNTENGIDQSALGLRAAYTEANLISGLKTSEKSRALFSAGASSASVEAKNKSITTEQGQPLWLQAALAFSYSDAVYTRPSVFTGEFLYAKIGYREALERYKLTFGNDPLYRGRQNFIEAVIKYGFGTRVGELTADSRLTLSASDSALSENDNDFFLLYSNGGPELRYNRIAGFAFSEYRAPVFLLVNNDFYYNLTESFALWWVLDYVFYDREFAGKKIHSGTGIGAVYSFATFVHVFARADYAISAGREDDVDRWQFFFGVDGRF